MSSFSSWRRDHRTKRRSRRSLTIRSGVDILAELDASHREFVGAAAAVPEPHFVSGGAARETFEGAGAGHYREHAAQIHEWRQPSPGSVSV